MGDLQASVQGIGCCMIWLFSDDISAGVLGRRGSFLPMGLVLNITYMCYKVG
jgi:hypothetical protein